MEKEFFSLLGAVGTGRRTSPHNALPTRRPHASGQTLGLQHDKIICVPPETANLSITLIMASKAPGVLAGSNIACLVQANPDVSGECVLHNRRVCFGVSQILVLVAGIGIRISVYGQAIFVLICVAVILCTAWNGVPSIEPISRGTRRKLEAMRLQLIKSSLVILLTGCALVVSAFIQARYYGLSVYMVPS